MRSLVALSIAALVGACAKGSVPLGPEDDDDFGAGGDGGEEVLSFGGSDGSGGDPSNPCPTGLSRCGPSCVDVTESPLHCGGCFAPCAMRQICVGGSCVAGSMTTTSASTGATSSVAASSAASSGSGGGGAGCHPLNPAAVCGSGSHCVPQTSGVGQCLAPAGFGTQYFNCFGPTDCAPIYDCITTPYATSYCMQWCSSDFDCSGYPSDTCIGIDPPLYAHGVQWGVCYDGLP
ncbi:MAG TPA: hypothetical protein ENK57_06000 [Polyangiaceae bacterium]|nr:hypothetical protein [Polyangiaceae bacterium]